MCFHNSPDAVTKVCTHGALGGPTTTFAAALGLDLTAPLATGLTAEPGGLGFAQHTMLSVIMLLGLLCDCVECFWCSCPFVHQSSCMGFLWSHRWVGICTRYHKSQKHNGRTSLIKPPPPHCKVYSQHLCIAPCPQRGRWIALQHQHHPLPHRYPHRC